MSSYTNGVGYLIELRDDIDIPWFTKICDLSIDLTQNSIGANELAILVNLFLEDLPYTSIFQVNNIQAIATSPNSSATNIKIEKLAGFDNFKGLSSDLSIEFPKRITLFFGTNGSGKSSICEALKLLGTPNIPESPLKNVKIRETRPSRFEYKFSSQNDLVEWNKLKGYGLFGDKIKFFDSKLAFRYVNNPLQPENSIEISPFRLEIFEYVRTILKQFQEKLLETISVQNEVFQQQYRPVNEVIEGLRINTDFDLSEAIRAGKMELVNSFLNSLKNDELLRTIEEEQKELEQLISLSSDEGIKNTKRTIHDLSLWIKNVKKVFNLIRTIDLGSLKTAIQKEKALTQVQETLLRRISNPEIEFEKFASFIDFSKRIVDYNNIPDNCPFCQQVLEEDARILVNEYKKYLFNETEEELLLINEKVSNQFNAVKTFAEFDIGDFKTSESIQNEEADQIFISLENLQSLMPKTKNDVIAHQGMDLAAELKEIELVVLNAESRLGLMRSNYNLAISSKEELDSKKKGLIQEIEFTKKKISSLKVKEEISSLTVTSSYLHQLRDRLDQTSFQGINQKITLKAKKAYEDLIITGFETKLSDEYLKLTEKPMSNLGVQLIKRGREGSVILNPTVGKEPINIVLSEGELKIHSLALFFCELTSSEENIVVIDDPVTSLDYNYVTSFVERLRDFLLRDRDKQVILFTHDWAFFDQIRDEMNKVFLNNDFEVKVIEKCSLIKTFKEKIPDLKTQIESILSNSRLDEKEKKEVAGLMRILIEAIVNQLVFAGQKYKYKKGSTSVSNFMKCIKLIPLEVNEAVQLQDLYKKLSPFEHDDPSIWYVETDIVKLTTRYDQIKLIERNLMQRRP